MTDPITEQDIVESLHRVPSARWKDVLVYLDSLQHTDDVVTTGTDLVDSELIGIWKDRDDIADDHEFARRLRSDAEHRERGNASGY